MPDNSNSHTTVRETRVERTGGSSALAFIVGGLVVAVAIVAWVLYGGGFGGAGGGGDTTNISVETPAPAADGGGEAVPADPAPAAN